MYILECFQGLIHLSFIHPSIRESCPVQGLERQVGQLILLPAVVLQEVAITRETHSRHSGHGYGGVCVCVCRQEGLTIQMNP